MRRGEIWTVEGEGFISKPRPVIIIQNDDIRKFQTILICPLTTFDSAAIGSRPLIVPTQVNNLAKPSYLMTDKLAVVTPELLGYKIGELSGDDLKQMNDALRLIMAL